MKYLSGVLIKIIKIMMLNNQTYKFFYLKMLLKVINLFLQKVGHIDLEDIKITENIQNN